MLVVGGGGGGGRYLDFAVCSLENQVPGTTGTRDDNSHHHHQLTSGGSRSLVVVVVVAVGVDAASGCGGGCDGHTYVAVARLFGRCRSQVLPGT